jgi:hypothetical protein
VAYSDREREHPQTWDRNSTEDRVRSPAMANLEYNNEQGPSRGRFIDDWRRQIVRSDESSGIL